MRNIEPTLFDTINTPNSLKNVRVYLSGEFSIPKKEIISKLEQAGAKVRSQNKEEGAKGTVLGLAKTTCVIIEGTNPKTEDLNKIETLLHDGYNIPIISESEMNDLLHGYTYKEFKEPTKNINITYDFIFNPKFNQIENLEISSITHSLAQKEIYIDNITGDKYSLYQALGNIGAYANYIFDPISVNYCWLKSDTVYKLQKGEKDSFIQNITDIYNKSNSEKFNYKFILETNVIEWIEERSRKINDTITLELINKYRNSLAFPLI